MRRITVALGTGLLIACGGGDHAPAPSPSAQAAEAEDGLDSAIETGAMEDTDLATETGDGMLRIRSISLDPPTAKPGENVRVRVSVDHGSSRSYDLSYQWDFGGHRIEDDRSALSLPTHLRKGSEFSVHVTATDSQGGMDTATAQGEIENTPPTIHDLHLERSSDGSAWIAKAWGGDPDQDDISFEYTWLVNDQAIENQGESLPIEGLRRGDQVRVRVVATDGEDEGPAAETGSVEVANTAPEITSTPPRLDPSGRYSYPVKAVDRDGDTSLSYELVQGPDGMEMNQLTGELTWTPDPSQAGDNHVEVAVDDGKGGRSTQEFNVSIVVRTTYGDAPAAPER